MGPFGESKEDQKTEINMYSRGPSHEVSEVNEDPTGMEIKMIHVIFLQRIWLHTAMS